MADQGGIGRRRCCGPMDRRTKGWRAWAEAGGVRPDARLSGLENGRLRFAFLRAGVDGGWQGPVGRLGRGTGRGGKKTSRGGKAAWAGGGGHGAGSWREFLERRGEAGRFGAFVSSGLRVGFSWGGRRPQGRRRGVRAVGRNACRGWGTRSWFGEYERAFLRQPGTR